jgi:hypothetical protein
MPLLYPTNTTEGEGDVCMDEQRVATAEMRPREPLHKLLVAISYLPRSSSSRAGHAWSPTHRANIFWLSRLQFPVREGMESQ